MRRAGEHSDAEGLAECIGLVARLGLYHADREILEHVLRCGQSLDLGARPEHRGHVEALIESAWACDEARPCAEEAFDTLGPAFDDTARGHLAERLLRRAPSCRVWARAVESWRAVSEGRPNDDAPRPLQVAYDSLVRSGAERVNKFETSWWGVQ